MVQIAPFSGFLYNQRKTGGLSEVTAPPYDVIKPDLQNTLYQKNPYNVVRLILGHQFEEDTEDNNRYTRSAKDFADWVKTGILTEDSKPHYYAYNQEYEFEGRKVCRMGFFARVRLEDFSTGNIFPHEFTLAKAKKDRFLLMTACRANFSPIFGLFSDASGTMDQRLLAVSAGKPVGTVDEDGILHSLWRIEDEDIIAFLTQEMRDKKIYIADGHHRYETALAYYKSKEVRDDSAHVMMFLTNMEAESLSVFAIHRLVLSREVFDRNEFISHLEEHFDMESLSPNSKEIKARLKLAGQQRTAFVVYLKSGECFLLKTSDPNQVIPYLKEEEPTDLKVLDVVQLHSMIIRPALGIDTLVSEHQQYVSYTIDISFGMAEIDAGKYDVAFFMNPTSIEQIRKMSEKGLRLPQKATYFYPKLLSGLIINKFCP